MAIAPYKWMEVSLPRPMEPVLQDPHHSHSHSQNCWAYPRGSLSAAHGKGQSAITEKTDAPATPPQDMMPLQSDHNPHALHLGLWRLHEPWGEESVESGPTSVICLPPKEARDPYKVIGSSVTVTQLIWHPILGEMYIDMLTCMLSIVGLGLDPVVEDHHALALQELPDSD